MVVSGISFVDSVLCSGILPLVLFFLECGIRLRVKQGGGGQDGYRRGGGFGRGGGGGD